MTPSILDCGPDDNPLSPATLKLKLLAATALGTLVGQFGQLLTTIPNKRQSSYTFFSALAGYFCS